MFNKNVNMKILDFNLEASELENIIGRKTNWKNGNRLFL